MSLKMPDDACFADNWRGICSTERRFGRKLNGTLELETV